MYIWNTTIINWNRKEEMEIDKPRMEINGLFNFTSFVSYVGAGESHVI